MKLFNYIGFNLLLALISWYIYKYINFFQSVRFYQYGSSSSLRKSCGGCSFTRVSSVGTTCGKHIICNFNTLNITKFFVKECDHEKMKKVIDECIAESGVSPDLVKNAFHDGNFANDDKLKCFLKCIHIRGEDMDDTGKIVPEKFVQHLGPKIGQDKATLMMTNCKDSKGSDPCDTAFIFSQCVRQQFVDLGIEPQKQQS